MKYNKHYDLILAWANGAEVEYYRNYGDYKIWVNCTNPVWDENREYRIKPEPKTDIVLYAYSGMAVDNYAYLTSAWAKDNLSKTPNIKLTYDGETNELKSAEKI